MAYTTIDDPSAYFHTQLYTGTGSELSVTNGANAGDFKPDWIWIKQRNAGSTDYGMFDSSRGVTKNLKTNTDDLESTEAQSVKTFNTDGFTLGTSGDYNGSSDTHVAWQWKANGGTTASNSNGSITSTVQANTTAGFSIITYTGNATADATVGHGLSAAPQVYWCKGRTYDGGAINWIAEWSAFTSGSPNLNLDRAPINYSGDSPLMTAQATTITHTTARGELNDSGTHVIYCWTPIQGYSKFGSYTGNANADGPFIYTGFKPAWLLIKRTDSSGNWVLIDSKRDAFNQAGLDLNTDSNAAENSSTSYYGIDLLSNGFKLRNGNAETNGDGTTNVYMAFAESPFVSSEGVPTTAR